MRIDFPTAYAELWSQIAKPPSLVLTINSTTFTATNLTLTPLHLFAYFPANAFPTDVSTTTLTASFDFKNPNKSLECSGDSGFLVSFFDFKANSIAAETLSNNEACPVLD